MRRAVIRRVRTSYYIGLAAIAALGLKFVGFYQSLAALVKKGLGRLRDWYWQYVQNPNNPVDRAVHRAATATYGAIQRVKRDSMVVGQRILAFILATVSAVGVTLIIGASASKVFPEVGIPVLIVAAAFVLSLGALLGWFASARTIGATTRRFRLVIVTEFLAFGILGVLVAVEYVYSLF